MPKPVSDTRLRNEKPKDKNYRIPIGDNAYLEVMTTGLKVWRMRYNNPITKKPAIHTIGYYPLKEEDKGEVGFFGLADVRIAVNQAKQLVKRGIDPTEHRTQEKKRLEQERMAEVRARANTFQNVALAWHTHRLNVMKKWKPTHAARILTQLEDDVFPVIGAIPIAEVTAPILLEVVQVVINRGALEAAKKLNQRLNSILRYAATRKLVRHNEADNLRDEIPTATRKHNPHLTAEQIPAFLRAIQSDATAGDVVKIAILFTMRTLARTNETRFARWDEFDMAARTWTVPGERMKMGITHIVPLPDQVMALLEKLQPLTGNREYLFYTRSSRKPISENAMLYLLYRLGYKGVVTIHGLRGTASTILNGAGFRGEWVEAALAHKEKDAIRAAYNHAVYLEERREMLQWYSDHLDALTAGAQIIPINRKKA